ncbi:MAG: hypothetical protein JWO62_3142 [Acidimicrobiaceae bacterium]|nr:hypothetical protein [Acidimicrobiaceae bacterium]
MTRRVRVWDFLATRRCQRCGELFVTSCWDAVYCDELCEGEAVALVEESRRIAALWAEGDRLMRDKADRFVALHAGPTPEVLAPDLCDLRRLGSGARGGSTVFWSAWCWGCDQAFDGCAKAVAVERFNRHVCVRGLVGNA